MTAWADRPPDRRIRHMTVGSLCLDEGDASSMPAAEAKAIPRQARSRIEFRAHAPQQFDAAENKGVHEAE